MSTVDPVPTPSTGEPTATTPYAPNAATASVTAPAPVPLAQQPYFAANLTVLIASALLLLAFALKDELIRVLFDNQVILGAVGMLLSIALFVTSLVLRSKTKRAGGRLGLATTAVIISSVTMTLIVLSLVVLVLLFGLLIYIFTGGL